MSQESGPCCNSSFYICALYYMQACML
jgi:hypothetical protein